MINKMALSCQSCKSCLKTHEKIFIDVRVVAARDPLRVSSAAGDEAGGYFARRKCY